MLKAIINYYYYMHEKSQVLTIQVALLAVPAPSAPGLDIDAASLSLTIRFFTFCEGVYSLRRYEARNRDFFFPLLMLMDEILPLRVEEPIVSLAILQFLFCSWVDQCLADIKLRTALIAVTKGRFDYLQVDLSFEVVSEERHSKILMDGFSGKLR